MARTRLAWCSDCLREDVAYHAESHGRLAWRLGFCVICPRHLRLLEDCCSACGSIDCGFAFRLGRLRLVCAACGVMVDQLPDQVLSRPAWAAGPLGLLPSAALNRLVVALQADLIASMFDAMSRPWKNRGVAERLASTVRELSAILLEAASVGAWRPLRLPQQAAVFSALGVRAAYDLLGLGAVVLTAVATGTSSEVERLEFGFPCDGTAPVTLARLFSKLGWRDLDELRARAPDWPPLIACAVQRAIDCALEQQRRAEEGERVRRLMARWRFRPQVTREKVKRCRVGNRAGTGQAFH
jgi:hypothetical protein